ncbi:hypothetical protein LR48_Vigan11g052100 [Vigna angularis]|uniref:Uncharacterized protein n=1 Tax=Phaseolus angularis TaxID=3914 RepID=A0A0L9VRC7_PHAAN|nr:hypothetical protein LR48_Vigan11g052100 [Vigna angularis]
MTREGSERRDKGKGVARPKKRQRQAPNTPSSYPCNKHSSSSCDYYPHCSPVIITLTSPLLIITPTPPLVIIIHTPPPVIITHTAPPDPTSIPSSSSIPPSETATPSIDLDLAGDGDGDGVDSPLHGRPWIEPYGKGFIPSRVASQAITRSIKQQYLNPWATWGELPIDSCSEGHFTAQALGRAVHVDEVFAQTHVRKGTNEFVDERSRKTHEEFSTRLSHIRSEHGSAPTPDDATNGDDDIRTIKHQPSSSTTTPEETIERLTQLLQQCDQENHDLRENYSDLRTEFTNFKSLVMRALPDASNIHFTVPPTQPRPSPSPVVPQQPTSVQPTPVQPTPVQPSI